MNRIYLAARYSRNVEMCGYRDELHALGHRVTSRWIDRHADSGIEISQPFTPEFLDTHPELCAPYAEHDLEDVKAADTVISFTGHGGKGGRHVEFGYATALEKRLILVGGRENIFHSLPQIHQVADWPTARALFEQE